MIGAVTAADVALDWWQAFGEGNVDELWRLSSRPVRYMLARAMVANEVNARSATGDERGASDLLVACQTVAVHGARGPAWGLIAPHCVAFFAPVDMRDLLASMRLFPRTEEAVAAFTQITFHPPDTPSMPWTVDVDNALVVGFAGVLQTADQAGALGERLASDRLALWRTR
jgi:hypothetical protein